MAIHCLYIIKLCERLENNLEMENSSCKVCVTGGAGYMGSSLVKTLLDKGYTVHATLRNLTDESKVGLLRSFRNAKTRLELFEADIYEPESFEQAIKGCQFVFHVANPMFYSEGHKHNNRVEATVDVVRSIAFACMKTGTVKRLIYTASVVAASPLKNDGDGYKDFMDESCWTPLDLSVAYSIDVLKEYTDAKTLAEKELLNIGNNNAGGLEVVTLGCGLVGGETYLSHTPASVSVFLSPLTNNEAAYKSLKFLEELLGKVPCVHIEDVSEALVFCMESPSLTGRVLCASSYVSTAEIAEYYQQSYPEFNVQKQYLNGPRREIQWGSTKLTDEGFTYKYDMKMILDDCISCARKIGDLQLK